MIIKSKPKVAQLNVGRNRNDDVSFVIVYAEDDVPTSLFGKDVRLIFEDLRTGSNYLTKQPAQYDDNKAIITLTSVDKTRIKPEVTGISLQIEGVTLAKGNFTWSAEFAENSGNPEAIGINYRTLDATTNWFEVVIGPYGKTAYVYAVEHGYTGTEEEFGFAMADLVEARDEAVEARDETLLARDIAVQAKEDAEEAQEASEAAQVAAEAAQTISESARDNANLAKNAAVLAQSKAEEAQEAAEAAQIASESARDETVNARDIAVQAKDDAVAAKLSAEESEGIAVSAKDTAVSARDTAVLAKNDAESAKDTAVAAANTAVSAKEDAEDASNAAIQSKNDAYSARNEAILAKEAAELAASTIDGSGKVEEGEVKLVSGGEVFTRVVQGVVVERETIVPFDVSGYYLYTGVLSSNPYGHTMTAKTNVVKGDIVRYGVNTFSIIGSVGVLNFFDSLGNWVKCVKRLSAPILSSFFEDEWVADENGQVVVCDYTEGNYGEAYLRIVRESKGIGLNYLVDELRRQARLRECYNRGSSDLNLSTSKKIGIIVAGQSNADGRVPISEAPEYITNNDNTVPGVLMWNHATKTFAAMKYGVNSGANSNTSTLWAFDAVAGYMLSQAKSENIYLIKRTRGGTAIDPNGIDGGGWWTPYTENIASGHKLIEELKDRVVTAMNQDPDLEIKAILWHQGESDSIVSEHYYDNLLSVISYIRGVCRNPKLPFILGTISENSSQYNSEVDEAMRKVSEEDAFVYIVDMKDGTLLDPYHFDAASTVALGEGMYSILDTLV